jgi:ech hydrogenase subunit B
MLILVAVTFFGELLVDNISSRMTWQWMLTRVLAPTMLLCVVNILWIYSL